MEDARFTILVWLGYASLAGIIIYFTVRQLRAMSRPSQRRGIRTEPIQTIKKASGLQSDIMEEGTGPGAEKGDRLTVHYTAFLTDGRQVDSSRERGRTLSFVLGAGKVIDGWEEALLGAKEGERRRVSVPPALAYGRKGTEKVPPNATVIFEVELLKVQR